VKTSKSTHSSSRRANIIGDLTGCDIALTSGDLVADPGLGDFVDDKTLGGGHFPLLATSPAINRGSNEVCSTDPVLSTDQLGQARVGACDIGAVEFGGALTIAIDVRPQRDPNRINPNSNRNINVALLSGDGFVRCDDDRSEYASLRRYRMSPLLSMSAAEM
jgi:hypothetical protein